MALFQAHDDPQQGAPLAICGPREFMCLVAPDSCVLVPGSVPPIWSFNRFDYTWLALALCTSGDARQDNGYLDSFYYGTHTLTWAALHSIVMQAVGAGFSVDQPFDIAHAVRTAMDWAAGHSAMLKRLLPADFELLPAVVQPAGAVSWWNLIPFSLWSLDSMFHPLCHAMGYAGAFWSPDSRAQDSRLHISLLLTQEFLPVSSRVPPALHGEPAVRFYASTICLIGWCASLLGCRAYSPHSPCVGDTFTETRSRLILR